MEMSSTPPGTNTLPSPLMIRWEASAIVCRPEEQKRFTVIPGTVIRQPARSAIWRAMFQPVAPSGLAQPMITSSTSWQSTFARSIAACTTCAPILAPCVMLSAPFQLLQSGVRAVETITASMAHPPRSDSSSARREERQAGSERRQPNPNYLRLQHLRAPRRQKRANAKRRDFDRPYRREIALARPWPEQFDAPAAVGKRVEQPMRRHCCEQK